MVGDPIARFRQAAPWIAETERRTAALLETDPELQGIQICDAALAALRDPAATTIQMLELACRFYGDRPCLGMRERALVARDGEPPTVEHRDAFATVTYAALWRRVCGVASGLVHAGIAASRHGGGAAAPAAIGIFGYGSIDWVVADFACLYLAAISVPIATNLPADELEAIIKDAALGCIVCSASDLPVLGPVLSRCPGVEHVVVMDLDPRDEQVRARLAPVRAALAPRVQQTTLDELAALGAQRGRVAMAIPGQGGVPADALLVLLYTSGSTGTPKGAMYTETVYAAVWRSSIDGHLPLAPTIGLSYLPLGHGSGRLVVVYTLLKGGTLHFTHRSDMSTWFADVQRVRPTSLHLVPRASEMIYQRYQSELVQALAGGTHDPSQLAAIEARLTSAVRQDWLGGRLTRVTTGTAPTSPEIARFIERCLDVPVTDYYGATENGGEVLLSGHVSPRITAWKLVEVPELGYSPRDRPFPRGELYVKSTTLVPGYYQNPGATAELLDEDGFMRTGDVVEQRGPDAIAWIDRKHAVIKLAQGDFVNPSRLEGTFVAATPFIAQLYVFGDSRRSYLLAVVVPDRASIAARLGEADDAAIQALLRDEIARIANQANLRGFEIPRAFLVSAVPFTRENGLLTDAGKPARGNLKQRFGGELEALYAQIERRQAAALAGLAANAQASVRDRVVAAFETTLGIPAIAEDHRFRDLGGDSLGAVRLSHLLEHSLGVAVPASRLLDPRTTLRGVIDDIERGRTWPPRARSFAAIHGADPDLIHAGDLRLERFLDDAAVPAREPGPGPGSILLTGANGFLGRFLLLELLDLARRTGGHVACVVRAADDAGALDRLRASYGRGAAAVQFEQARRAARLDVLAGDVGLPRLGLDPRRYDELASSVTGVIHNAALVNHAIDYRHLFEPNVAGTAEVARFVLRGRGKALGFVSTAGIAAGRTMAAILDEETTARAMWERRPARAGDYASGYVTSKWAGELLVDQLHERHAVPVRTFRCGMILAHPRFAGQLNPGDYFTRLLVSLVTTGVAPPSFYAAGRVPNFQGVSVDLVARTIVGVTAEARRGREVFHVLAGTGGADEAPGGASLDEVVRWIRGAGYPIEAMGSHAAWFASFRARLDALPAHVRAQSLAPIVEAWARPLDDASSVRLATARFREALRRHANLDGVPGVTEAVVHRCLDYLADLGLICARTGPRPAT